MSELKFFEHTTSKNPQNLVVFLHGYGANGENLINLANEFKIVLPKANFISPNAVEKWEGGFPNCYQWFSLYGENTERKAFEQTVENIKKSNEKLTTFIDDQLKRFNLTPKDLILVGFSQGAMMAIYNGLARQQKIKSIVAYSGRVILPNIVGEKILSKPEICLIHGEDDAVVPFDHFIEGKKILANENIPFDSCSVKGLDHSIDISGIRYAMEFLKKVGK